jgi:hypothetical protein
MRFSDGPSRKAPSELLLAAQRLGAFATAETLDAAPRRAMGLPVRITSRVAHGRVSRLK